MHISKTDYIAGTLCEKRLWLSKHMPDVCINTENTHTQDGNEVGALARRYFEGAVTVPLAKAAVMAAETKRLIEAGETVICEATFMEGGLGCSVDIVLVHPDGLDVIEVKSSTSVKDIQREDVAFQCHVIRSCGFHIRSVRLMYLNKEYVRHGDLDLTQLFTFSYLDASDDASVRERALRFKQVCRQAEEPPAGLACRCEKPYECPCKAYCFQQADIPAKSVFNIPGMTAKKKYELYQKGIVSLDHLYKAEYLLTNREALQVRDMMMDEDAGVTVDKIAVRRFLRTFVGTLYFLDFETFQTALPRFDWCSPYTQVPFQYSLHVMYEDGSLRHEEFLAEAGEDPRRALAEKLCSDIPIGSVSVAYNASFEKSVCRHLAETFPDLSAHLLNIADNMLDLMVPFRNKWVVSPAMHGGYSIKVVLPALCGDDPDLNYHQLPVVHNGAEAMETYSTLHLVRDREEVERIRKGLLLYCCLDTLAMVKVFEKTRELCA